MQKKSRSEGQRRTSNARTVATSPELSKSCEQDKNKNKNKKEIVPQTTIENKNKSKIEPKHNKQNKHLCNHTLRRLSTVLCARSTEPVHARLQRADDARHAMHRPPPPRAARASRPSLRDQPLHRAAATLSIVCRSQTNKTNKQKERRLEIQTMQLKKIDISEEKKQAGKDEVPCTQRRERERAATCKAVAATRGDTQSTGTPPASAPSSPTKSSDKQQRCVLRSRCNIWSSGWWKGGRDTRTRSGEKRGAKTIQLVVV